MLRTVEKLPVLCPHDCRADWELQWLPLPRITRECPTIYHLLGRKRENQNSEVQFLLNGHHFQVIVKLKHCEVEPSQWDVCIDVPQAKRRDCLTTQTLPCPRPSEFASQLPCCCHKLINCGNSRIS